VEGKEWREILQQFKSEELFGNQKEVVAQYCEYTKCH
jgi:hypothetical protein